jgi:hypothetical protein
MECRIITFSHEEFELWVGSIFIRAGRGFRIHLKDY